MAFVWKENGMAGVRLAKTYMVNSPKSNLARDLPVGGEEFWVKMKIKEKLRKLLKRQVKLLEKVSRRVLELLKELAAA